MKNRNFIKWILPLSCLLLINCFTMATDDSSEKTHQQININTASAKELVKLPGIGQALAQRIIDFREKNGPFKKIEDLMRVRGIGEKNFKKMKDFITIGKSSNKER